MISVESKTTISPPDADRRCRTPAPPRVSTIADHARAAAASDLFALVKVAQFQFRLMLRGTKPVGRGALKVVLLPPLDDRVRAGDSQIRQELPAALMPYLIAPAEVRVGVDAPDRGLKRLELLPALRNQHADRLVDIKHHGVIRPCALPVHC